jgi:hypothetical protein
VKAVKGRKAAVLACLIALTCLFGCDNILEDDIYDVSPHQEPVATSPDSVIEASTYSELKADILGFVSDYEDIGQIRVYSYDGDVQTDVDLACRQIMSDDPLGAYAVSEITGKATQIVSHFQVEINVRYKVTKEQLDSIITVPSIRLLQSDLKDMLSEYARIMVIRTKGITLTEENAQRYIKEIYYENPLDIVMMPVLSVDFYPENATGTDRIIVFTFGYTKYEASTLKVMQKGLNETVQNIAESVSGSDGEILLSLAERLMEIADFDAETASGGEYSDQNTVTTAYGALVNGSAVGEGYAMAFKALCDELGFDCDVVLGQLNGKQHAWNIVALENDYYHVDVSMCDTDGVATSFLLNDTEMAEKYSWDRTKYKICDGPLTYDAVAETLNPTDNDGGNTGSHTSAEVSADVSADASPSASSDSTGN